MSVGYKISIIPIFFIDDPRTFTVDLFSVWICISIISSNKTTLRVFWISDNRYNCIFNFIYSLCGGIFIFRSSLSDCCTILFSVSLFWLNWRTVKLPNRPLKKLISITSKSCPIVFENLFKFFIESSIFD